MSVYSHENAHVCSLRNFNNFSCWVSSRLSFIYKNLPELTSWGIVYDPKHSSTTKMQGMSFHIKGSKLSWNSFLEIWLNWAKESGRSTHVVDETNWVRAFLVCSCNAHEWSLGSINSSKSSSSNGHYNHHKFFFTDLARGYRTSFCVDKLLHINFFL